MMLEGTEHRTLAVVCDACGEETVGECPATVLTLFSPMDTFIEGINVSNALNLTTLQCTLARR